MKSLVKNKLLLFSMVAYFLVQLLQGTIPYKLQVLMSILHELLYLLAILIGCIILIKSSMLLRKKVFGNLVLFFFIPNFVLFILWVFTVYLNPKINWKLEQGRTEVDPSYIILYVPIINFSLAFLLILIVFSFKSLFSRKNTGIL